MSGEAEDTGGQMSSVEPDDRVETRKRCVSLRIWSWFLKNDCFCQSEVVHIACDYFMGWMAGPWVWRVGLLERL